MQVACNSLRSMLTPRQGFGIGRSPQRTLHEASLQADTIHDVSVRGNPRPRGLVELRGGGNEIDRRLRVT